MDAHTDARDSGGAVPRLTGVIFPRVFSSIQHLTLVVVLSATLRPGARAGAGLGARAGGVAGVGGGDDFRRRQCVGSTGRVRRGGRGGEWKQHCYEGRWEGRDRDRGGGAAVSAVRRQRRRRRRCGHTNANASRATRVARPVRALREPRRPSAVVPSAVHRSGGARANT